MLDGCGQQLFVVNSEGEDRQRVALERVLPGKLMGKVK